MLVRMILAAIVLTAAPAPLLAQRDVRTATSVDGVEIRYEARGLHQTVAPIVFVHGFTCNRSFWEPHLGTFSRTHPVVALDLAGFGESGTNRSSWTMDAFGNDVVAVLRDLDLQNAILVGYSMGAGAVIEAALEVPERVGGVVIVDWLHDPHQRHGPEFWRDFSDLIQANWQEPAAFLQVATPLKPLPDSLIERYERNTPAVYPDHWQPIIQETFRWADEDLLTALDRLQVPLAAINSDEQVTDVEAFRRHVPSFDVSLMPRLSHLGVIWQETELFDRYLAEFMHGAHSQVRSQGADTADHESEIEAVWDAMSEAVCSGDWESYSRLWAHSPQIELIHAGQGEWLVGWETIGPWFKQLLESGYRCELHTRLLRIHVSPSGNMAWITSDVTFSSPGSTEPSRAWQTGVFERVGGQWRAVLGTSTPAPDR